MKGVVYKIVCRQSGDTYYGSTIEPINRRISGHKSDYKRACNGRKRSHYSSFPIFETNDYYYEILEELEVETKLELRKRERWYIENNECINQEIPSRTKAEYSKFYKLQNRDKINERRRLKYKLKKEAEKNNIDILYGEHTQQG